MAKVLLRSKIQWSRISTYVLISLLVAFTSLPLIYLVSSAFKPLNELFIFPPRFFVRQPTIANFTELLATMDSSSVPFSRFFFNSVWVSVAGVTLGVMACSLAAFSMTKMKLPYKELIFQLIIATLMFSPAVTQISSYIIVTKLGMVNTYWALIVPKIAGSYYFFLMKQNMQQIPDALLESAKIDGCRFFSIFTNIIMPLSRPVVATVVVFAFIANWNDFYSPLIYINKQALKTLPLALQMIQGGPGQVARSGAMAAAAFLTTLPTIIVFLFMQSKVVKTMAHTGIK